MSTNESSSDNEQDKHPKSPEKPKVLHTNENVTGDKIYKFQTPKRDRIKMIRGIENTPINIRSKVKKAIVRKTQEDAESHDEIDPYETDSGSEYNPDSSSSTGSEVDENESESDEKAVAAVEKKKKVSKTNNLKTQRNKKTNKYVIKTDDYFSHQSSKKNATSNHTLDKLETPRLPQNKLLELIRNMELTAEHTKRIEDLSVKNQSHFLKWLNLLYENFNVLLYGLGSKRDILKQFQEEHLSNLPTIVVNGFFPSLSITDVTNAILQDILHIEQSQANPYTACTIIEEVLAKKQHVHIFVIVHNIEGSMLRNAKSQNVLSRLSLLKNVHLIASIDHINAPLVWDFCKLSKFNFTWWDVTSYLPYIDETSFEGSLLVQKTGTLVLSSLRNVFSSLTANSKGIFVKIAKYQLEHSKEQYYQGYSFKDLYWNCRESFLVSSDLALRAQLTEFSDHKMIKFRRSADGTELIIIPLNNKLLEQFLEEQGRQ